MTQPLGRTRCVCEGKAKTNDEGRWARRRAWKYERKARETQGKNNDMCTRLCISLSFRAA